MCIKIAHIAHCIFFFISVIDDNGENLFLVSSVTNAHSERQVGITPSKKFFTEEGTAPKQNQAGRKQVSMGANTHKEAVIDVGGNGTLGSGQSAVHLQNGRSDDEIKTCDRVVKVQRDLTALKSGEMLTTPPSHPILSVGETATERQIMEKDIFGQADSDSDWEDMDGEL